MTRTVVLGLALCAGLLALLVLWLVPAGRGQEPSTEPESSAPAAPAPVAPELLASSAPEAVVEPHADPGEATAPRVALAAAEARISGIVLLPESFPVGEEVFVVGRYCGESAITATFRDGSFSLIPPAGATNVSLELDSRMLSLRELVIAEPGDEGVLLRPEVLACVRGEIVPPESPSPFAWSRMKVECDLPSELALDPEARVAVEWALRRLPVTPEGGRFTLERLPVGVDLLLRVDNPFGPDWQEKLPALAPCEGREVRVELEAGVTIAGTVVDEHDEPVAGVQIVTEVRPRFFVGRPWERKSTDDEGRFVLERMGRRVTRLGTFGELARQGEALVDASAGDVRDVRITVERGVSLEGRVRWADGQGAESFEVELEGPTNRVEDGSAGRFRLSGLRDGEYRVAVRSRRGPLVGEAVAESVRPGAAALELVLEAARGCEVRGLVVSAADEPIPTFQVSAARNAPDSRYESVSGASGRFQFPAFDPGEWTFEVQADGYQSARQTVALDGGTESLRFVLPAAGRIRGRVLDASGAPAAGAWVGDESEAFIVLLWGPQDSATDSAGCFEIPAPAEQLRLVALKEGSAPSEVVVVEAGAGTTVEGVVLRLRAACGVTGRVLDERGRPLAGARVWPSFQGSERLRLWAESDAAGNFELDHLPPAKIQLQASLEERPEALARATLVLAAGEKQSVELRFAAPDPVRIRGRVLRDGRPFPCNLELYSTGFSWDGASTADGGLDLTLQQPGEWSGWIWSATAEHDPEHPLRTDIRRVRFVVPDADEHVLELDFATLERVMSIPTEF